MIICLTVLEIMVRGRCNNCYFSFWAIFCPFTPLTAQKIKISKKWKRTHGDIIILHKFTKNYDYRLYYFWNMARDGCNCCFSFLGIFCQFTPSTAQKWKPQQNEKSHGDIIILHNSAKNYDNRLYYSWDIACGRCNSFFILGYLLPFYPPQQPIIWQSYDAGSWDMKHRSHNFLSVWDIFCPFIPLKLKKIKIEKNKKTHQELSSFYTSVPKVYHDHMLYHFLGTAHGRCNYFSFWINFCSFMPLTAWKIKI